MLPYILAFTLSMSVLSVSGWLLSSWIRRKSGVSPRALANIEERLSRIEQAVDATAIEVERISEGQRFTTKVLTDRSTAG